MRLSLIGAPALVCLAATVGAAGSSAMRPAHTAKLTPDTFDEWVQMAVDSKKTAFVRWMASDTNAGDCTWIAKGFHGTSEEDLPPDQQGGHTDEHFGKLASQVKNEPCQAVRAQAEAWNKVTEQYKDDPAVLFGDVVMSDYAAELNKMKALYSPNGITHEESSEEAELLALDDPDEVNDEEDNHDGHVIEDNHVEHVVEDDLGDEHTDPPIAKHADGEHTDDEEAFAADETHFEIELGKLAYDPELGGCHITHYNDAAASAWTPHCLDMLEPLRHYDADGNLLQGRPDLAIANEDHRGELFLHHFVEQAKQDAAHLVELDRLDQF